MATVAVAGLAAACLLGGQQPARAECAGVTVVVDFHSLGGGVQSGCATSPADGLGALAGAGFGYTFAARQPGYVCRINGKPGAAQDACVNASPITAYWSYWHAQAGGSWVYSTTGPGSAHPANGSVEGWSFGAGQPPGIAPPARPVPPPPPPKPPQQATTTAAHQPVGGTTPARTGTATGPATGPATDPPAATSGAAVATTDGSPAGSSAGSTVDTTTAVSTVTGPVAATSASEQGSGGWFGLAAAVVLIAVLGGLGWRTARRRGRNSP